MVSTTHFSLQAASFKMTPTVELVGRAYIPKRRQGKGEETDCPSSGDMQVNRQSSLLDDLLQHLGYSKLNHRKSKMNEVSHS